MTTPTVDGPRDVLARYHSAMIDLSADDLADLYAVDAVHEFPFVAPGGLSRLDGREQVRAGYTAAWGALPARVTDIRNVVIHETADPELIVSEQDIACTADSGTDFTLACVLVMRVHDGQITHLRDYADALGAALALGRLPALVERLSAA